MKRKTMKKLLAVMMIIIILTADFFVLGSNLITYAAQINSETNNSNIEFSAYFKNETNERVDSVEKSIKNQDLKLYAEIKVKNNGYLNGSIEIKNSNFNIKQEILPSNTHISSIEGNKVNLRQINAGETVEIELGINPIISDKMPIDMLSKVSTVKLTGTYLETTYKGIEINSEKTVCVNYKPDETAETELKTDIITNKVFSVKGTDKRIVQVLIQSRLSENQYPIKQTTIKLDIPKLSEKMPEEVSVLATGKLATNGKKEITSNDWINQDGILQINLKNEADANNEISWSKNVYDELIVTLIYAADVNANEVKVITNTEIQLHNTTEIHTGKYEKGITNKEPNNIIIGTTDINTTELYKGQLYANIDMPYTTTSKIIVTKEGVVEEIVINDGQDVLVAGESELEANTKYITTEINKQKVLDIFGQDGNIEIKNGENIILINKETEVNENGNVVINHQESTTKIDITTSNPVKAGVLEIKHTKAIVQNNYTREQLQKVTELKAKNRTLGTVTVNKEKQNIVETSRESIVRLNETISKAQLTIENNKQTLSTEEANEITLGVTLRTDSTKYDLYKNPTITLQLPSTVENVEFIAEPSKVNANEFEIISTNYDSTNKTIKLNISGEQKAYAESSATQAYFQLNLKLTLSQVATTQNDAITLTYTNENATQYENNGIEKQQVIISAPSKVITMFNLESNSNTSLTESFLQRIENNQSGKTLAFQMTLVNNEETTIDNVRILGKLPTIGNVITKDVNTLETILKSITASNAEIYYTENVNATDDTQDATNAWTKDLASLTNAKMYLIKINTLAKGATYTANMTIQLPTNIAESGLSYTQYEVIYDTATEKNAKENSRKIGIATSLAACIKPEIIAQVGNNILTNGDIVKEGEVIRYTISITNKGNETLKDVKVQANVPEGTVLVRPIQRVAEGATEETENGIGNGSGYVYAENAYYEEITDSEKIAEIINETITELAPNKTYSKQYEVRVDKGAAGKEISNIAIVECDGSKIQSQEVKNKIKEANIRVTIKRTIDESIQLYAGGYARYKVYIENLSDKAINNLEMQIISDTFKAQRVESEKIVLSKEEGIEKIEINKLEAKEIINISLYGKIQRDVTGLEAAIIVTDSNNEKYRSNVFSEVLPHVAATINMTSPQNNKYIKEGDIIEYNVTVKNTGDIDSNISVKDMIPSFMKVQSVYVDGVITRQCTDSGNKETYVEEISNNFLEGIQLQPGKEAKVQIVAKVGYISELQHGKVITNYATVEAFGILEDTSEIITHILQSNSTQEDVKNVISGLAWLDSNGNGKKDIEEDVLPNIIVKLYDLSKNQYMTYENGTPVVTKTDSNGEYSFMKIKNGSYLIVFEYDMNKYEHTTSFAEGVDTSVNSKVILKEITINGETIRVATAEALNLQNNIFNMNIGLKAGNGDLPPQEEEDKPINPDDKEDKEEPDDNVEPDKPIEPEEEKRTIEGVAWLDLNRNGQKDLDETALSGIGVKIYDVSTKNYLLDEKSNIVKTTTDAEGKYKFNGISDGEYILVYEYDTEKYTPTIYLAEGVDTTVNSKVVLKNININGKEITTAVTDLINVTGDISNINIGLKENLIFDLELNKYISKIVVQTNKETKTYNYENDTFEKVEIHRKQIQGALVVLEYTIKVKNTGEITGYAKNIVDYVPSGLTFTSELNKDWYLSENNLHTKALENVEIAPGEEKEVKLILTKTMTNDNTGLINNRAELYQDYNKFGEADVDSKPNNQVKEEDDYGAADVIILVSTGGSTMAYTMLLMINTILIGIAIKLMIKNRIIIIPTKKERR